MQLKGLGATKRNAQHSLLGDTLKIWHFCPSNTSPKIFQIGKTHSQGEKFKRKRNQSQGEGQNSSNHRGKHDGGITNIALKSSLLLKRE